jgi:hypothetical protein
VILKKTGLEMFDDFHGLRPKDVFVMLVCNGFAHRYHVGPFRDFVHIRCL